MLAAGAQVLRDLRDTEPTAWANLATEWGTDSKFYSHMAEHHPPAKLSPADYHSLVFDTSPAESLEPGGVVPELSEWTSLTLDDMTGHGEADEPEQYHLARGKATADGYTLVHWSEAEQAILEICNRARTAERQSPAAAAEPLAAEPLAKPTVEELLPEQLTEMSSSSASSSSSSDDLFERDLFSMETMESPASPSSSSSSTELWEEDFSPLLSLSSSLSGEEESEEQC